MNLTQFQWKRHGADRNIYFRPDSVGDRGVIDQIFQNEDYRVSHWPQGRALLTHYQEADKRPLIIDAGANIGASAVYFHTLYPQARIVCIEPERSNCTLLRLNTDGLPVDVFEGGISGQDGHLFLQDPGHSDWGFRVGESGTLKVPTVSPATLLKQHAAECDPFILKIDIEGGEQHLFDGGNLDWLTAFSLVVIELHDWMLPFEGSSSGFMAAMGTGAFDIVFRGENLFCFNRNLARHLVPVQAPVAVPASVASAVAAPAPALVAVAA